MVVCRSGGFAISGLDRGIDAARSRGAAGGRELAELLCEGRRDCGLCGLGRFGLAFWWGRFGLLRRVAGAPPAGASSLNCCARAGAIAACAASTDWPWRLAARVCVCTAVRY